MFASLFGEVKTGRLARLQYLGYSLLIGVLVIGLMIVIVFAMGAGEHILGGDLRQAQEQLRKLFTVPLIAVLAVVGACFAFAGLNIMAKRIRDMGLPGWWGTVIAIIVLPTFLTFTVSPDFSHGVSTLIWLVLIFVPGDAFGRKA